LILVVNLDAQPSGDQLSRVRIFIFNRTAQAALSGGFSLEREMTDLVALSGFIDRCMTPSALLEKLWPSRTSASWIASTRSNTSHTGSPST
jgi:hypothetical protein